VINRNVFSVIAASGLLLALACPGAWTKPASKPAPKPAVNKGANTHVSGALNAAYTNYINQLRGKLDSKWYLADGRNRVTITLNVDPAGSVTDLKIVSSPANTQAEQAASDAFNQSQPLAALPSGSPPIKLTLVFESYADPHGDNNRSIKGQIDQVVEKPAAASTESSSQGEAAPAQGTAGKKE
jgi:TonB family protein